MPSASDRARLPDLVGTRRLAQSIALLDAILCPAWEHRYYSFCARWAEGESLASMRDGQGDSFFLHLTAAGALLKGFAHRAAMSPFAHSPPSVWPGVLDAVPAAFARSLAEPAFSMEETTFCIWRTAEDTAWQCGRVAFPSDPDPDGSARLLALLDGDPHGYQRYAEEYHEQSVSLAAVEHIYAHRPLTPSVLAALRADRRLGDLREKLVEIGYPT